MLDFAKFTVDNLAVTSLHDLISLITFESENWDRIITRTRREEREESKVLGKLAPSA